jgi:hypothetical protein
MSMCIVPYIKLAGINEFVDSISRPLAYFLIITLLDLIILYYEKCSALCEGCKTVTP